MKLSVFAKQTGITYLTAYRWWKLGYLNGRQVALGTIVSDDIDSFKVRDNMVEEGVQPEAVTKQETEEAKSKRGRKRSSVN